MHKVNIAEKFSKISEFYKPHIAGELNGQMIKLVKANTEFVWHHHDHEDEMFLVVKGRFRMDFRDEALRELTNGSAKANSSSFRAALSTSRWPRKNAGSCCSSPLRLSTPATWKMNVRSTTCRESEFIRPT